MAHHGVPFPQRDSTPPLLPVPRQPSPLSLSSHSEEQAVSPLPSPCIVSNTEYDSTVSSACHSLSELPSAGDHGTPRATSGHVLDPSVGPEGRVPQKESIMPIQPMPDSLLFKHTLSALDASAITLKRFSKNVLAYAAVVHTLSEQLEKAEDDLFGAVGELSRWLETGYDIQAKEKKQSVWEDHGIRKFSRDKRRREREEMEVRVEQSLKDVKAHLKRRGLAGSGAQVRYETTAKQFYHATSVYLLPQSPPLPHGQYAPGTPGSMRSQPAHDMAQAVRHASWDLVRYTHHSALLSAVPPSSEECLNLLVGLYGWVASMLGEQPKLEGEINGLQEDALVALRKISHPRPAPLRRLSTPPQTPQYLKTTLSTCLAQLSKTRSNLLAAWAQREHQTRLLEDEVTKRQAELDDTYIGEQEKTGNISGNAMASVSSAGVEYRKQKKHRISKSVGGRLRDLLSSSQSLHSSPHASSSSLAFGQDRSARYGFDGSTRSDTKGDARTMPAFGRLPTHQEAPDRIPLKPPSFTSVIPTSINIPTADESTRPALTGSQSNAPTSVVLSPLSKETHSHMQACQSVQIPGRDYVSPLKSSSASGGSSELDVSLRLPSPFESIPDLGLGAGSSEKLRHSMDSTLPLNYLRPSLQNTSKSNIELDRLATTITVGGVGGLGAGGDEDELREEAGRKKEGSLWSLGTWEGLTKSGGGKGKWEKYWVVLDHSSIYEYRDSAGGPPGSAHAVIDLKFASVREGRGTDRRFVFEIVTPSQGRRLYQATSDHEMKQWLYAICNAIESCINGTSTVRTIDQTKGRGSSGAYDDHALPARSKYKLGFSSRNIGLGLGPLGSNGRKSMPPTPVEEYSREEDARIRKTSLKKVLKQSGEKLSGAMASVSGGYGDYPDKAKRNSFGGLDISRPVFGKTANRQSLPLSAPERVPPPPAIPQNQFLPNLSASTGKKSSWADGEIEKRVLEMAGLGLGSSPSSRHHPTDNPNNVKRRVKSEAVRKHHHPHRPSGEGFTRSKSDDGSMDIDEKAALRTIAAKEGNRRCADCGGGMRASRWATISLHNTPIVLFLCIRCVGVHRSLGTHISKTRSVDMDNWAPEQVVSAQEWGNIRGNAIWEAKLEDGARPSTTEDMRDFIKQKYGEGQWLRDQDRERFGLA
ncbi:hypothetical protein L204_104285 [Cryptococcus depauperatus]